MTCCRQSEFKQRAWHQAFVAAGLREIYRARVNQTLYIAGDGAVRYGETIAVIDASKGAGVNRVGIITAAMRRGVPR